MSELEKIIKHGTLKDLTEFLKADTNNKQLARDYIKSHKICDFIRIKDNDKKEGQ